MRDDARLGCPLAKGKLLDHVCPICEGDGAHGGACFCEGRGVITRAEALRLAKDDPDPRWAPRPLPAPPPFTGKSCGDCAFRVDSDERGGGSAYYLFYRLEMRAERDGKPTTPFYCHDGMHHSNRGYVPRQQSADGVPIGHPVCAGWLAMYHRDLNRPLRGRVANEDIGEPHV